jgi:hypothetical protein
LPFWAVGGEGAGLIQLVFRGECRWCVLSVPVGLAVGCVRPGLLAGWGLAGGAGVGVGHYSPALVQCGVVWLGRMSPAAPPAVVPRTCFPFTGCPLPAAGLRAQACLRVGVCGGSWGRCGSLLPGLCAVRGGLAGTNEPSGPACRRAPDVFPPHGVTSSLGPVVGQVGH